MRYHAVRNHPSFKVPLTGPRTAVAANFVTNGSGGPAVGAPFHEPCIDDTGVRLNTGVVGTFFSGETLTGMSTRGSSIFSAQKPRVIKGSVIQFDAVLNKTGYHYPQQRIITLWQDAVPVINKQQPPEPLVFRMNTFDCAVYSHTNLVPKDYEIDDFQVRTPTDVIGQHIHLPKLDLTTTDGAANGWNYEDGTLSPGAVRERIDAIRAFNHCTAADRPQQHASLPGGATASVLRPVQPARLAGRPHHRWSAGSPTRWSTPRAWTAAWASSSRTTTSAPRRTSRSACTRRCSPSPRARAGGRTKPERSWVTTR